MGAYQSPKEWGPLLTAMVTPMNSDGTVNYSRAEELAHFLVDRQKNSGIVVAGTTGESPTLTDDEKLELLRVVISAVGNKAAVLFGAGTNNTLHSVHLTEAGAKAGAHGIMLVSPYYNKPNQEGLFQHFKTIAEKTDLPVLLYNIQGRTAVNIETPTLVRLATHVKNICAVKEASGNLAQVAEVAAETMNGFRIYSGDDILILPVLSVGGVGVVSVAGHIVGTQIRKMIEDFFKSPDIAADEARRLVPVIKAVFCTTNPAPIKYAVTRLGVDVGPMRLPMVPLTSQQQDIVDTAMAQYGLFDVVASS